jgi:protein gp37
MAAKSAIEWTEATWNPVTGCSKVSTGCKNCYAERMAIRLRAMGQPNYRRGFQVAIHKKALSLPMKWKTPTSIFVNSMSDLFHPDVPIEFILNVFDRMNKADWHRYQILTKRSERLLHLDPQISWARHIWMGVTVETADHIERIEQLRATSAAVKFISFEPLLGPMPNLDLRGIDWAIVGGESGPGARPMDRSWVLGILDQCLHAGVPFFFKQWGGTNRKKSGRLLEGKLWSEMPALDSSLALR